jgi:hypothetical protein
MPASKKSIGQMRFSFSAHAQREQPWTERDKCEYLFVFTELRACADRKLQEKKSFGQRTDWNFEAQRVTLSEPEMNEAQKLEEKVK